MKFLTITLLLIFNNVIAFNQDIKNLYPQVEFLDFSDEAKALWARRDTLLKQIDTKEKDWDSLTDEEKVLLEKGEAYEDIWDIVGQGCSWYCAGGPADISASSYLTSQDSNSYEPKNAHDLNYKTAWVEGVKGYGIGEYLEYTFAPSSPRVTEIIVVNGYVKSTSAYQNNSRVKKLKVYLNDKPYAILNLQDRVSSQTFTVAPIGNGFINDKSVLDTLSPCKLKFEIMEVYKGLKYDDVVISEIYFDGLDVHCFVKGTEIQLADNSTKNIEELMIGDSVAYMDFETNRIKSAKIEKLEKVTHCNLVTFTFASGKKISATQDHPFKIANKGWASLKPVQSSQYNGFNNISKITIGDIFLTANGPDRLITIDHIKEPQETYTISKLSTGNNFFANGFIVGVEEIQETIVNH